MSFHGNAGQQGSFQGYMPRKGPDESGGRQNSGSIYRNANFPFPGTCRPSGSEHNYNPHGPLLKTPPPSSHLHSHPSTAQPQAPTGSLPCQIIVSFNAPQSENLLHSSSGAIPRSRPGQVQPTGAMLYPDPPPPYTPYAEVSPLSSPFYQDTPVPDELRGPQKKGLPERGKGNRMKGGLSQSMSNLQNPHKFDEVKREQPESANTSSNYNDQRMGQAFSGQRGHFQPTKGNRGESNFRDGKNAVGGSSVGHGGDEFSGRPSSDETCKFDEPVHNQGRRDNKPFRSQRGRGQQRGQSGGVYASRGGQRRSADNVLVSQDTRFNSRDSDGCRVGDDSDEFSGRPFSDENGRLDGVVHNQGRGDNKHPSIQRGRGQRKRQSGGVHVNRGGRRKSADMASFTQDIRGNNRDSNEHEELFVQLHFATCFETASILKKHIQSALHDVGAASLELSYEEILLEHKLDKSSCNFSVSDCNISSVQKCIEKMVSVLRRKLQISVYVNLRVSNGTVKGSFDKDTAGPGQETVSKRKKKKSRSNPTSKGQDTKNTANTPIPTTLCFSVEKCFSSPTGFKTFLRNATSSLGFDFDIDDGTVDLTDKISKCQFHTKSKADARKLKQCFVELQKQTQLSITCNLEDKLAKEQETKNVLDNTKSTMLDIKSQLVQKHEERISQNKEEFKKNSCALPNKKAEVNFKAIHDKLSQAIKQRDVFMKCFDKLFRELELLDNSASHEDDIKQAKHLFNIECNQFSRALPIYAHKERIINQVEANQVSIIVGENGCGKSTQIAQFLFDAGFNSRGVIVCTQPAQLTALSLADKVSKEKAVKVGNLVGYKTTGMAAKFSSSTKILYSTDHSLLNEFHEDPLMEKYSCIIVDEAHEHSMYTDLLLGMIKSCLPKRPDLKIIVISVPGHQEVFLRYFKIHEELRVSGSKFAVDTIFTDDSSEDFEDYEDKAICQALKIHAQEGEGDILIFVSLPIETLRCCQEFESRFMGEKKNFICLPLHSKLPGQELKKVFDMPLNGQRKIIFTTKYAETSVSIDNVRYIVDTGVTSETKYDPEQKVNLTTTCPVSQLSAMQRRGCAGHSLGGKCYHLYSKKVFDKLTKSQFPEILRVHLEKAILKLFEFNVDMNHYEFLQAPSEMALGLTIDTLTRYGAIDFGRQITEAGKMISAMPFDPKLGSLIVEAHKIGLLYEAIVLAAIISLGSDLSYRSVSETETEVDARNKKFLGFEKMDCFAWYRVYKLWSKKPKEERSEWCRNKSINYKLITSVRQYIEEVHGIMKKYFKIEFRQSFSEDADAIPQLQKLYLKCKKHGF